VLNQLYMPETVAPIEFMQIGDVTNPILLGMSRSIDFLQLLHFIAF